MKTIVIMLLLTLTMSGCNGQKTSKNQTAQQLVTDSLYQPQVDIRVNKQYDSKGNLIKYDSTYSYFYKGPNKVIQRLLSDSLFAEANKEFHSKYDSFYLNKLGDIFFTDTLLKYDFLNSDYFSKRFEMNRIMFHDLYREMDSLKTEMLKRSYPEGEMKRIEQDKR